MAYLLRRHEWRERHIHKMLQQSGHVPHAAAALCSLSRPSGRACSALGQPRATLRLVDPTAPPRTSAPRAPAEMPLRCIGNGGGWSFGELSFGLSAQVVPKSRILARKRASFGNQSILTRRNDKVSYLLNTKYSLNYEYVGTNPAFC